MMNLNEETVVAFPNANKWESPIDVLCKAIIDLRSGQELTISLRYTSFLKPSGVIILFLTALFGFNKSNNRVRIIDINKNLFVYLERMDFFKNPFVYTTEELLGWERFARNNNSKRVIEITRLSCPKDIFSVITKTREILKAWFPEQKYEEYCNNVSNILMEICGNSIEHSKLPDKKSECFFLLQQYNEGEGIAISVGDLGIGVRNHIMKRHIINNPTDSNYILQALSGQINGRPDGSGGMGLTRVRQITDNYKGQLFLRSGQGMVKFENNNYTKHSFLLPFPGTQCSINLYPKFTNKSS